MRFCADSTQAAESTSANRGFRRLGTSGRAITIGADRRWVDTGIDVRTNDRISITANGRIRISPEGGTITAAGVPAGRTEGATMPTGNVGGLVARFGNSPPLFIGESRTFRTGMDGRLYLGVNDNFFDDNTGAFTVTVDVN
jgi:hypothetical protein